MDAILSPRESEVLKLRAEGLCRKEIAVELNISRKTVEYFFVQIHNKLKTSDVALLTQWALKTGLANWKI